MPGKNNGLVLKRKAIRKFLYRIVETTHLIYVFV